MLSFAQLAAKQIHKKERIAQEHPFSSTALKSPAGTLIRFIASPLVLSPPSSRSWPSHLLDRLHYFVPELLQGLGELAVVQKMVGRGSGLAEDFLGVVRETAGGEDGGLDFGYLHNAFLVESSGWRSRT